MLFSTSAPLLTDTCITENWLRFGGFLPDNPVALDSTFRLNFLDTVMSLICEFCLWSQVTHLEANWL